MRKILTFVFGRSIIKLLLLLCILLHPADGRGANILPCVDIEAERLQTFSVIFRKEVSFNQLIEATTTTIQRTIVKLEDREKVDPVKFIGAFRDVEKRNREISRTLTEYKLSPGQTEKYHFKAKQGTLDFEGLFIRKNISDYDTSTDCFRAMIKYQNIKAIIDFVDHYIMEQNSKIYGVKRTDDKELIQSFIDDTKDLLRKIRQFSQLIDLLQ